MITAAIVRKKSTWHDPERYVWGPQLQSYTELDGMMILRLSQCDFWCSDDVCWFISDRLFWASTQINRFIPKWLTEFNLYQLNTSTIEILLTCWLLIACVWYTATCRIRELRKKDNKSHSVEDGRVVKMIMRLVCCVTLAAQIIANYLCSSALCDASWVAHQYSIWRTIKCRAYHSL